MAKKLKRKTLADCVDPVKLQTAMREALPDCTDEEMRDAFEKIWVYLRNELDEIKERITLAEVTPHIGKCFLDFEYAYDKPKKVTASNFYMLLGASGYGATYLHVRVDDKGVISIEPEEYTGTYIIKNYKPISNKEFRDAFEGLIRDLREIKKTI